MNGEWIGNPERWAPVVGFEGFYEVSDRGAVRSTRRRGAPGGVIASQPSEKGHLKVNLYRDNRGRGRWVHQLVLEAFVGPRPAGHQACHNDGNPANNQVCNLRWDTPAANGADAVRHGTIKTGSRSPHSKLTEADRAYIRRTRPPAPRAPYGLCRKLAAQFGVNRMTITAVWRGSWR